MPQLVPVRYGRMLVSPFTFYRGAALIMASDLAATPVSGVTVQLCGDAHLSNFGLFGTPERQMIFDINDFDETLPGPWEWDVKRLAASFEIMGRDRGFARADRRAIVRAAVSEYRDRIRQAAGMGALEAWYDHLEAGMLLKLVRQEVRIKAVSKKEARALRQDVAKAHTRDNTRVFTKRASEVEGELRIVAEPPLIIPIEDLVTPGSEWEDPVPLIKKLLSTYRRTLGHQHHPLEEYRYVHTAYKMVGVGSVGTRCYIMLMLGRDRNDPLFLQIKEAQASVLEHFAGQSTYPHHGERVVAGQRLMQAATDIFLGWIRIKGLDGVTRDYYVRQFHDWKGSADVDNMLVPGATLYARLCGATLARAHARWGDRIAIASYLGKGHRLRPGDRRLLGRLRRPEREGLRGVRRRREVGTADRRDRPVRPGARAVRAAEPAVPRRLLVRVTSVVWPEDIPASSASPVLRPVNSSDYPVHRPDDPNWSRAGTFSAGLSPGSTGPGRRATGPTARWSRSPAAAWRPTGPAPSGPRSGPRRPPRPGAGSGRRCPAVRRPR